MMVAIPEGVAEAAVLVGEKLAEGRPDVNLVYFGAKRRAGDEMSVPAVVFVVNEKMSAQQLANRGVEPLPETVTVRGVTIPTDIEEGEPQRAAVLRVGGETQCAYATDGMRSWHDYPIPGGVQISPVGADWVGTLGAACRLTRETNTGNIPVGFVTNRHVACGERFPLGHPIGQPSSDVRASIGLLDYSPRIRFDGAENYLDVAFVSAAVVDAGRVKSRISPHVLGIGFVRNSGTIREPKHGDIVVKTGRTTGHTKGRVVGTKARTTVDYGDGKAARFVDQVVVEAVAGEGTRSGEFSAPGDSGSVVLFADTLEPAGLLFAGGGSRTTMNRIFYLEKAGIQISGRKV